MATYYVDATGGNDDNTGLSTVLAWKTIGKVNGESFSPSDEILFKKGETLTDARLIPPSSGTSGNNIVFDAYGSGTDPTLSPSSDTTNVVKFAGVSYVTLQNFIIDATNVTTGNPLKITELAHHITVQDGEIKNGTKSGINTLTDGVTASDHNVFKRLKIHDNGVSTHDHGLYIETANNLFEDLEVYNNYGHGFNLYNEVGGVEQYDVVNNNIIRYCKSYDNNAGAEGVGTGILMACGENNLAHHNVVWDNDRGIQLAFGADNEVYSNTVYSVDDYGIRVSNNFTDAIVKNNISYNSGVNDFLDQGTTTTASNNLAGTDPLFIDVNGDDYRLNPSSPARNAGTDVGLTRDHDGVAVPRESNPVIGAYELVMFPLKAVHAPFRDKRIYVKKKR